MLKILLRPGESAWDVEIEGSIRSDLYDGFYSIKKPCFYYINTVIKSKWCKEGINYLIKEGIEIETNRRDVMNMYESVSYFLAKQRTRLFNFLVPNKYKRRIRKMFSKSY